MTDSEGDSPYISDKVKPLPADGGAEAGALSCILSSDQIEAPARLDQLSESDFHDLRHIEIFRSLLKIQIDEGALDVVALFQRLSADGRIADAGGKDYVCRLPDVTMSATNFPTYLSTIKNLANRRSIILQAQRQERAARDLTIPAEIPADAQARLDGLIAVRRFDFKIEPPEMRPIYLLSEQPICTPGNLAALSAAVKSGKTAVVGAMMASTMAEASETDMLGFKSSNPSGRAIIHFDSEQSPDDHWHCNSRMLKRAKRAAPPAWFESYCLTGLDSSTAWRLVQGALKKAAQKHNGIHSIVIDGVADLVLDVNDPGESNAFVAKLHGMAIEYDCPIIGVIHFNPGSDKTRGHLGSQFERKAETNLRLDKSDDVTTIWSEKQRRAPIPKESGPCFYWSDEAGMHVSTGTRQKTADEVKAERFKPIVDETFGNRPSMRYSDLVSTLKDSLRVSPQTAERRVAEMNKLGLIKKSVANLWVKAY